jgi:hypothetical protein
MRLLIIIVLSLTLLAAIIKKAKQEELLINETELPTSASRHDRISSRPTIR